MTLPGADRGPIVLRSPDPLCAMRSRPSGRCPELDDGTRRGGARRGRPLRRERAAAARSRRRPRGRDARPTAGVTHGAGLARGLSATGSRAAGTGSRRPERCGGMGLPPARPRRLRRDLVAAPTWPSRCCPLLTSGAIEALHHHALARSEGALPAQARLGEWTGTMNLTEPQAGSDLGALRTRAERRGDGSYRITGQKIFITYGDHDLTENIVHLVLARLPDAPPGTRGISLFLVPKILVGRGRQPRRAQRPALRRARAQARHACGADLHHGVRRRRAARPAIWSARRTTASPACSP